MDRLGVILAASGLHWTEFDIGFVVERKQVQDTVLGSCLCRGGHFDGFAEFSVSVMVLAKVLYLGVYASLQRDWY